VAVQTREECQLDVITEPGGKRTITGLLIVCTTILRGKGVSWVDSQTG